jgi:hypothetical protein
VALQLPISNPDEESGEVLREGIHVGQYHRLKTCRRKKNSKVKETSFVPLDRSWLPLSEYPGHHRWKSNC